MRRRWYFFGPIAVAAMVLFAFLGGEIVRLLWNWLTPTLFGWRQITFWQAFGLLVLCRILFGGFGARGVGRSGMRDRMQRRMAERWDRMTPEERERYRQRYARWGCGTPPPDAAPSA